MMGVDGRAAERVEPTPAAPSDNTPDSRAHTHTHKHRSEGLILVETDELPTPGELIAEGRGM